MSKHEKLSMFKKAGEWIIVSRKRFILVIVTLLIVVCSVVLYLSNQRSGFRADVLTGNVTNTTEGTYTTDHGNGNIDVNSISIPVDLSQ